MENHRPFEVKTYSFKNLHQPWLPRISVAGWIYLCFDSWRYLAFPFSPFLGISPKSKTLMLLSGGTHMTLIIATLTFLPEDKTSDKLQEEAKSVVFFPHDS